MIQVKKVRDKDGEEYNKFRYNYVDEECSICHKRMTDVRYIYYDLVPGNYCCKKCRDEYGLDVVQCKELNY